MSRFWLALLTYVGFAACAEAGSLENQARKIDQTCTLTLGVRRTVSRIIDGETVGLDDGSQVRLIGALAPRARDGMADQGKWSFEELAKQELKSLLLGQIVQLAHGRVRKDRYGRYLAHLFIGAPSDRKWIQSVLLSEGLARAYAIPEAGECLADLIAHERSARNRNLGLWSQHAYRPISAERTTLLLSRRSTFQIVRGKVSAISRTAGGIYLNFGPDWRTDFSVRISSKVAGQNKDWANALDDLKGREIEVRGWILRNNGPMIEMTRSGELSSIEPLALASQRETQEDNKDTPQTIDPPRRPILKPHDPTLKNEESPDSRGPGSLDL